MKKILIILFFISLGINGFSQWERNTVTYTVTNNPNAKPFPPFCTYRVQVEIEFMWGGSPCMAMQIADIPMNGSHVYNFNVDPVNLISTHISAVALDNDTQQPTGCAFSNLSLTTAQVFNCCCYSSGHTYWTPLGNNTFNIKGHTLL